MDRKWRRLSLLALALASCRGSSSSSSTSSDETVRAAVLEQFDSLTNAIRRVDVERMLSFYSSDSSVVRSLDGQLIVGQTALAKNFRDGFATVRSLDRLDIIERHLSVLGSQSAILTVQLEEQFTDTAGHTTALHGVWTSAWKTTNGAWRIIQDAAVHTPVTR
jgi:ketosteroid isomerase-like protein